MCVCVCIIYKILIFKALNLINSYEMQFASFLFQIWCVYHQDDYVCMKKKLETPSLTN